MDEWGARKRNREPVAECGLPGWASRGLHGVDGVDGDRRQRIDLPVWSLRLRRIESTELPTDGATVVDELHAQRSGAVEWVVLFGHKRYQHEHRCNPNRVRLPGGGELRDTRPLPGLIKPGYPRRPNATE